MAEKVQITYEDLEGLAKLALQQGTEYAFVPLALQWAKATIDEVARLRALHHDCATQLRVALQERDEARDAWGQAFLPNLHSQL